jgi:biopolymer transport protein ExbD
MEPRNTGETVKPEAKGQDALDEQNLIRGRRRRHQEDHGTGELNIIPYLDIVTNLVMFLLQATAVSVALGEVTTKLPATGGAAAGADTPPPPQDEKPPLRLTVVIGETGFTVAGAEAVLAGTGEGGGPTIPRLPTNKYDFTELTKLMVKIKKAFPKETQAFVVPEDQVRYGDLVETMDAMRENGPDVLFPDVMFAGF